MNKKYVLILFSNGKRCPKRFDADQRNTARVDFITYALSNLIV